MRSYILLFSLISLMAPTLTSCEKMVEVAPPINELPTEAVFTNDASALSAASGMYATLVYAGIVAGGYNSFNHLSGTMSDELNNHFDDNLWVQFSNNALTARNDFSAKLWSSAYNVIYQANSVIKGLDENLLVSEALRNQLRGEALFLRAFSYSFLVAAYGSVPVATTTDYIENGLLERSTTGYVYEQIIADLTQAKELLVEAYPSAGRVRANKWAAAALLARVYLYNRMWELAEREATEIIDQSMTYKLEQNNLEDVFLATNEESIWQIKSNFDIPEEGSFFILFAPPSNFNVSLSADLFNAFEPGDKRKIAWIGIVNDGIQDWYFPYKYKRTWGGTRSENSIPLRLAETYLIRAEARAQLEKIDESKGDLDVIRERAGLLPTSASDKSSVLSAIEKERRVELFAEDGHRWKDLVRTSRAVTVLQASKGQNFQANDTLLPIPFFEIQKNRNLTQNNGYN